MKNLLKIFILSTFIFVGFFVFSDTNIARADSGSGSVTVIVNPAPISGVCGSSNGGNFYSAPTSGYCNAGTYSGISGSGPWSWSCSGSNGGTTSYCSANKTIDGGWSAWSAKDTTPGYTGTQTRTCTNPSPAYGGIACVGSSTQSYTNAPSAPTGFGAAPSSCNNNWLNLWWNASYGATNYKVYRSGTLVYDGGATSFSDGGLSLGSSYSYTITASNAGGTSGTSSTSATVAPNCPISGVCGSSNGGNFYSAPTSGYCNAGTYSGISGSGPWTWSCAGLYLGTTASCSANKTIDGGWTAWSVPNYTCSYYAQTKTQTRTCTNPAPAYGGADCVGSATQTYSVPACLADIVSFSISPNPVPYGGTATITYSCANYGYYSHLLKDWTWTSSGGWDYTGYYGSTSGTYTTPAQTVPGSHTMSAYCYNSDWIPSADSWTSISYTVNPAPSGSLSASNCTIPAGSSSCNSSLSWSTSYPLTTSAITTPTNITVANANSGSTTYSVYYGTRDFYLYNNGSQLAVATASASCASDSAWYSGACRVPINGGWSAWSAKDTTPGYTGTQTRTCTNPSPAYGGIACVGDATLSYTNIPATPTGLGASASSCGNNWLNVWWNASSGATNYKVYRDGGTLVYNGSGTSFSDTGLALASYHTYVINASNAGGTSGNSSAVGATLSNACGTNPNIKATAWGFDNSDGPMETYTGSPHTLSWAAVSNASSCTINGGAVSVSGGTQTGTASARSQSFTLSCINATGQSASDIVTITTPPMPTGVTTSCSADSLTANVSWTAPGGYNTFYTRTSSGYNNDGVVGTSYSFPVSPNTNYSFWVHTRNPSNGAWSTEVYSSTINCARSHSLTVNKAGTGSGTVGGAGTYNYGVTATATAAAGTGSYFADWSGDCNSSGQATMTSNRTCTATFTLNSFALTVNKAGTGTGNVTGAGTYNYGSTATATASANDGSTFAGWSGDCSGTGACAVVMNSAKNVTATFTAVTASVVASPTSFSTTPSTNVSFSYTPSTSLGGTECRLLNNVSSPLTLYQASSPIVYPSSSSAGSYGYYVQCRNTVHTTIVASSALITVNVITVSVSATTPYNTTPGASVSFSYTPTSNPSGSTECLLLDNSFVAKTSFQPTSPIIYTVPNSLGAYGYYVKCRNTVTTTAMANSGLITVNTACQTGTTWNGSSCVGPTGTLTASTCYIEAGNNSCSSNISWSISNPIGNTAVTTPTNINVVSPTTSLSGSTTYPVYSGPRTFYLYNNGEPARAQATANATCTSGTVWNASTTKCESPTGTLTAGGCTIPINETGCPSTITWNTTNPLTGFDSIVKTVPDNTTIATGDSGEYTYSLTTTSKTFELWHNGVLLYNSLDPARATPVAVCAPTTHWNGSMCTIDAPSDSNTIFTATPSTIFEGRSSTLTWSSPLATSCTGTGAGFSTGGKKDSNELAAPVVVSPLETTTYTLKCTNASGSKSKSVIMKVIILIIKEQ